jgi:putative ABC transport system permease protein
MKTRYRKVLRDLTQDYTKNIMLVIAIAIGVWGIGSILGGYNVIRREMNDNYRSTIPASATIELEDNISVRLIDSIKKIPGIKEAERHATVLARMKIGDRWHPLLLFVIDDFAAKRTNRMNYVSGAAVSPTGTMLAERTAFQVMQAVEGDSIIVKTPNGEPATIKLSGTVHDPGLAPAWQEQSGYGYISLATLQQLGETRQFDQLRILVSEQPDSRPFITQKVTEVAGWLKTHGYTVHEIQIPSPNKHPHQSQMNTVVSIFIVFSYLIMILAAILVATNMATLMIAQTRQIGIMKTIGANSFQVMRIYLLLLFVICIGALIIGVPLSRWTAAAFYKQIAVLLNVEIRNSAIPFKVLIIQVSSGILIPFIAVAIPVIRGSLIPVRQALDNYGVSRKPVTRSWLLRLLRNVFRSEIWQLSVRNVLRQRTRFITTLILLAAGGAVFMTALNVSEAWNNKMKSIYTQRLYDLELRLQTGIEPDALLNKIRRMPGVRGAEGSHFIATSFVNTSTYKITNTYPDKGHGSFTLQALPLPNQSVNCSVVEGRWLSSGSGREVVLNQLARGMSSGVHLGDSISLLINEQPISWKVIGFTNDFGAPATAYVSLNTFNEQINKANTVNMIRVAYADRSKENAIRKNQAIEKLLEQEHIPVSMSVPVWLLRNAVAGHMKVFVNTLIAMAILMGIVGLLGLLSAMSISVMERTREIGVMRAIGATPAKIRRLVISEGFIIGGSSIVIAFLLSLWLSVYIGNMIGAMSFRVSLALSLSPTGIVIWVLIIVIGSLMATLYPARRAIKMATREALAYE